MKSKLITFTAAAALTLIAPSTQAALPGMDALADLIMEFDSNSDGSLDTGEFQSGTEEGFSDIDNDGDGNITTQEIDDLSGPLGRNQGAVAASAVPPIVKAVLMLQDANKDKTVSKAEYAAGVGSIFTALDANKDTKVTRDEALNLPTAVMKQATK